LAISPILSTPPLGPSARRFANGALLVESALPPPTMLTFLQSIENHLGRRRYRRWGARSVDIDIILWSGGRWSSRALTIPHAAWRLRDFVLTPLLSVAPDWRDPHTGLSVRHLHARRQKAARQG
jgi:2-amino-4-hydroxy-6-hydroxymethyldihydropteridine diphosphokinase